MATKYIVDNVENQTIIGDLTINGNFNVTGVTTGNLVTYKALLTQTASLTGTSLNNLNDALILNETYTITNYVAGDDFSNVANVISGNINESGCTFIATAYTPTIWSYGSELTSSGNLVVDVLENNLGFDLTWEGYFQAGLYIGYSSLFGPKYNDFQRDKTSVLNSAPIVQGGYPIVQFTGPISVSSKDDMILMAVYDLINQESINDGLYFTPIELKMKVDNDTTPVVLSGSVTSSYPFSYASVDLYCNGDYVEGYYGDNVTVNSLDELITELNSNSETSYLGTYSVDGSGNVILTMPTNLKNKFCTLGTLTFEIYAD